ncbi:calcium-binding protein [Methylobacillus flagellatus]|uniref:calcium-binding protein n=1 Tax=Methylobacillus flagellatus TaxID=405 RepID=UPI0010F7B090|nr:calcium-binding protein [Methylobacillus flagellatus]
MSQMKKGKPVETISGTDADDQLNGGNRGEIIFGGLGNDAINGNNGNDTLDGGDGSDVVNGGNGKDVLLGGLGDDLMAGDNGKDELDGGDGNDELQGGNGKDLLLGGLGDDQLDGGLGGDEMRGGDGDDVYIVSQKPDRVSEVGNSGIDTVLTTIKKYTLDSNVENLEYTGSNKFSGSGNHLDNQIVGGGADDELSGGNGNDVLIGGAGSDELDGGNGADIFVLNSLSGVDELEDFTTGEDMISIDTLVFTGLISNEAGTLDESAFGFGSSATNAEQRILFDEASGSVLYDADGAGGTDAVAIAIVGMNASLTATDFVIV